MLGYREEGRCWYGRKNSWAEASQVNSPSSTESPVNPVKQQAHNFSLSPEEPPFKRMCRQSSDVSSVSSIGPHRFVLTCPIQHTHHCGSHVVVVLTPFSDFQAMPFPPPHKWPGLTSERMTIHLLVLTFLSSFCKHDSTALTELTELIVCTITYRDWESWLYEWIHRHKHSWLTWVFHFKTLAVMLCL